MVCELCKTKHATIHITERSNGERREFHLCGECAQKKGVTQQLNIPIQDLLEGGKKGRKAGRTKSPKCPDCGITLNDIRTRVRLGCANDLQVFKEWLGPFIAKIHGVDQHKGKIPRNADETQRKENEMLKLKRSLEDAVRKEDFEKAAGIRDRLKTLDKDREGGE